MSILIKGIEMPKHDDEYVIFTVYGDGGVVYGPMNRPHVRYKNRAVPVPPHGRLGDLDELEKVMCEGIAPSERGGGFKHPFDIIRALDRAPTIIPAEEGKT